MQCVAENDGTNGQKVNHALGNGVTDRAVHHGRGCMARLLLFGLCEKIKLLGGSAPKSQPSGAADQQLLAYMSTAGPITSSTKR